MESMEFYSKLVSISNTDYIQSPNMWSATLQLWNTWVKRNPLYWDVRRWKMQKVKMHTIYTNDIDQENDASAAADVA